MYSCFEITTISHFRENFEKICNFSIKMCIFSNIYLCLSVKIIDIVGNSRKSFAWYTFLVYDLEFTTPCWSATSSLLHLNQF